MKRIIVIGGGVSGLAAAHRIQERGRELKLTIEVVLLEAGSQTGGIVQTEFRDDFLLERGPDSFITEKPHALELARRIGLESHLIRTNPEHRRSFVVGKGKLLPVPEGFHLLAPARLLPFLGSEIFSWRGKARMAMDLFLPRGTFNGAEDESLAAFVRRRFGNEALERMAQPMVGGIYSADPETLSLRATMPRFLEMEREHRSLIKALRLRSGSTEQNASGARYGLFQSFDQGMQLLTETLAQRIANDGGGGGTGAIRLNTSVTALELLPENEKPQRWSISTDSSEKFFADGICIALPVQTTAELVRSLDQHLAQALQETSSASSVTINLAYDRASIKHPLNGFGFVVPFVEKRTIMACSFSSVKFAGRAPEGRALLRVFVGGALQPELFELSDEELLSRVQLDLKELLGVDGAPLFTEVSRWKNAMPQYHLGHLDRVERIEKLAASLPNFALAGNAYRGTGIPDCIRSGEAAADSLLNQVS